MIDDAPLGGARIPVGSRPPDCLHTGRPDARVTLTSFNATAVPPATTQGRVRAVRPRRRCSAPSRPTSSSSRSRGRPTMARPRSRAWSPTSGRNCSRCPSAGGVAPVATRPAQPERHGAGGLGLRSSQLPAREARRMPAVRCGRLRADRAALPTSCSRSTARPSTSSVSTSRRACRTGPDPAPADRSRTAPPGSPGIVAGDYNFWGPGVVSFFPGWRRAVRGRSWPATASAQPDRPHPRAQQHHRAQRRGAPRRRLRSPSGAGKAALRLERCA